MRYQHFLYIIPFLVLMVFASCGTDPEGGEGENPGETTTVVTPPEVQEPEKPALDSFKYTWKDNHIVLNWQFLSRVVFEDRYAEEVDTLVAFPIFHDDIKAIDGHPVIIQGYALPFTAENGTLHVLSAYPFSNCFFCGGAGQESVMDIITKKSFKAFPKDQVVAFKGKLKLNDTDLMHLNYMLEEAEITELMGNTVRAPELKKEGNNPSAGNH